MIKLIKYLWIAYKLKAIQTKLMRLTIALLIMLVTHAITNDLINLATKATAYNILLIKWTIMSILIAYIARQANNIIQTILSPTVRQNKVNPPLKAKQKMTVKGRKHNILKKSNLQTKTEKIINQYKTTTQHGKAKTPHSSI